MAFDRIVEVEIFETPLSKLRIDNLEISFIVERSITLAENTLELTIYNANPSTRKTALKKGNNIIVKTGYADEVTKTIFIGNISYSASKYDGVNYVTTVQAVMARGDNQPFENINISVSYAAGTALSTVIQELAVAYGLSVAGIPNAQIALPNGLVATGTVRNALKYCNKILNDNSAGLYIDNNQIIIYKTGEATRFDIPLLSYENGLLSANEITEPGEDKKRIEFRAIMVSALTINSVIRIQHPEVDGTYVIEKLTFSGDNFGGEFNVKGEATA